MTWRAQLFRWAEVLFLFTAVSWPDSAVASGLAAASAANPQLTTRPWIVSDEGANALAVEVSGPMVTSRTWYVDSANTSGTEDGSEAHPFNTIQEGINAAGVGDTVRVAAGTYREHLVMAWSSDLTLLGAGADFTVVWPPTYQGAALRIGSDATAKVQGMTFQGAATGIQLDQRANLELERFVIQNCVRGIKTSGIDAKVTARRGRVSHCQIGVDGYEHLPIRLANILFERIGLDHFGDAGVIADGTVEIVNCTFAEHYGEDYDVPAIEILYGPVRVRNTIIWNCGLAVKGKSEECQFEYSCLGALRSLPGPYYKDTSQGGTNLPYGTDPMFVAPHYPEYDYHLLPTSPCIDAGDPNDDYSLEPQPNGGRIDMGAYGNTPEATSRISNRPPIAKANGPYYAIVGYPVEFDGSYSSDPDGDCLSYHWDFGDSSFGVGVKPSHCYSDSGTYSVILTVEDGKGGIGSDTTWATIFGRLDTTATVVVPATSSFRDYGIGGIWGDPTKAGPAVDCGLDLQKLRKIARSWAIIVEAKGRVQAHGVAWANPDGFIVQGSTVGGRSRRPYGVGQRVPHTEVATHLPVQPGFFGQLVGLFVDSVNAPIGLTFVVGSKAAMVPPERASRLLFAINDDGYLDNFGGFGARTSAVPQCAELNALNPWRLNEAHLVFSVEDTTHPASKTIKAWIHNNGVKAADSVLVQIWAQDMAKPSAGVTKGDLVCEVTIVSIAAKDSVIISMKHTFVPSAHPYLVRVHVDPYQRVEEYWKADNVARFEYSGLPPEITGIDAQYDGDRDTLVVGTFLPRVRLNNTFSLHAKREYNISKVEFRISGTDQACIDTTYDDGWRCNLDMAALRGGLDTLVVTAYDLTGRPLEPRVLYLKSMPLPEWIMEALNVTSSFDTRSCRYKVKYRFPPFNVINKEVPNNVTLIGSKTWRIDLDVEFVVEIGLDGSVHVYPAPGSLREQIFFSSGDYSYSAQVTINRDLSFGGASADIGLQKSIPLIGSGGVNIVSLPIAGVVTLNIKVGADLWISGTFHLGIDSSLSFGNTSIGTWVEARGRLIAELEALLGAASAAVEIDPRLRISCSWKFSDTPKLSGTFGIWYGIWAKLLWYKVNLASGSLGPWQFFGASAQLTKVREFPKPIGVLPQPYIASGPHGSVMVIWVADVGTEQDLNPEVYCATWDGASWANQKRITNNQNFETNPRLAFAQDGRAIAVWTQNTLSRNASEADFARILSQQELAGILTHQEIYYSCWNPTDTSWTEPKPITNDYFCDGMPTISIAPDGRGLALWTRALDDSLSTRTDWEIYYAVWDGSSWSAPKALSNDNSADFSAEIVHTSDGKAVAVWLHDADGDLNTPQDNEIVYSQWDWGTQTWSPPVRLTSNIYDEKDPSIAAVPNGDVLVTWSVSEQEPDSTIHDKLYCAHWRRSTSSATWEQPELVAESPHFLFKPTLATTLKDSNVVAMIMYRGYAGYDGDIFATMKNLSVEGSKWTAPTQITADTLTDWMATAAIDANSNALFASVKTDLSGAAPRQKLGNFRDGLSLVAKGITADLRLSDELNFASLPPLPVAPDLKIEGKDLRFDCPLFEDKAYATVGDTVRVTATIHNAGDFLARSTKVRFFDGHPDSGGTQIGRDRVVADVPPDRSDSVWVDWVAKQGVHRLYVLLDPECELQEVSDTNNTAFQSIYIVPDLSVCQVGFSNSNPAAGSSISVMATIGNLSGAAAAGITVRFFDGDPSAGGIQIGQDQYISSLPVGKRETVSVQYQTHSGVDTIWAVLDCSATPEKDASNNRRYAILKVLPDLATTRNLITLTETGPGLFALKGRIHNLGGVDARKVLVQFFKGDPLYGGTCVDSAMIETISAFSFTDAQVPWQPHYGSNLVCIRINPYRTILERDFNNNRADTVFIVGAKPDVQVSSDRISFWPSLLKVGRKVDISAIVENAGPGSADGVYVECLLDGQDFFTGLRVGQTVIPSISAGEADTVHFEWTPAKAREGEHEICVSVDPESAIPEMNETNNIACRSVVITDVELVCFSSQVRENDVVLQWEVANAGTLTGFGVERSSDGLSFSNIGHLLAKEGAGKYCFSDKGLKLGIYHYRLRIIERAGATTFSQPIRVEILPPAVFELGQNYPNPFNTSTRIEYRLPRTSRVTIRVFNILGQLVKTLVDGQEQPGYFAAVWDGTDQEGHSATSGVYLMRMDAGKFVMIRKLVLIR